MMQTATPHVFHDEFGAQDHAARDLQHQMVSRMGRSEASELQACHRTIDMLETRCARLEKTSEDLELRLERQAIEQVRAEEQAIDVERTWQERFKQLYREQQELQNKLSTNVRNTMSLQEKCRKAQAELQRYHLRKHEIATRAAKEERNRMKDKERATRDIRYLFSGGMVTNGGSGGIEPRGSNCHTMAPIGDPARRIGSSGSIFPRSQTGGHVGDPRLGGPTALRIECVVDTLSDFFNM